MKHCILALVVVMVSGCASSLGNKKSAKLFDADLEGKSYSYVRDTYGEPEASWKTSSDQSVYLYQYSRHRYSPLAYIPIVYYFTDLTGVSYEVVLVADAQDNVVDIRRFKSFFKSSHAGTCWKNTSYNECVKSVE